MLAELILEPTFSAGRPRVLFENQLPSPSSSGLANYDISADGQRFVMIRKPFPESGASINIVLNWVQELRSSASTDKKH